MFRRRRLAVLASIGALGIVASALIGTAGAPAGDDRTVVAAAVGDPVQIREVLQETTSTLVEATTTSVPAAVADEPTEAEADVADAAAADDVPAPTTTAPAERRTVEVADEPAPASRPAPTTTTAAPRPAPAPEPEPEAATATEADDAEDRAYSDPQSTQVWYDLAQCESGQRWSIDSGNGYYGGLQFSLSAWQSVGGSGKPNEHSAEVQIDMGRRLQARQGWGAWPHCSQKLGLR